MSSFTSLHCRCFRLLSFFLSFSQIFIHFHVEKHVLVKQHYRRDATCAQTSALSSVERWRCPHERQSRNPCSRCETGTKTTQRVQVYASAKASSPTLLYSGTMESRSKCRRNEAPWQSASASMASRASSRTGHRTRFPRCRFSTGK